MYSVDLRTGLEQWTFNAQDRVVSPPEADDRAVYVVNQSGTAYALDARSGAELWYYQLPNPVQGPMSLAGNRLYIGDDSGYLHAINVHTGKQVWSYSTGSSIRTRPAINSSLVIANNSSGLMIALNRNSGKVVWHRSGIESGAYSSPSISDATVYVGSDSGTLYALSTDKGKVRWKKSVSGGQVTSPAAIGNTVVAVSISGSREKITALKARTGARKWQSELPSSRVSAPAVSGDYIYLGGGAHLYALQLSDGGTKWAYLTDSTVVTSPVVASDRVYFSTTRNTLYALGGSVVSAGPIPTPSSKYQKPDEVGEVRNQPGYVDITSGAIEFTSYRGTSGLLLSMSVHAPLPMNAKTSFGYGWAIDYTQDQNPDYFVVLRSRSDGKYRALLERASNSGEVVNDNLPYSVSGNSVVVWVPLEPAFSQDGTMPNINWYAYSFTAGTSSADVLSDQGRQFSLSP